MSPILWISKIRLGTASLMAGVFLSVAACKTDDISSQAKSEGDLPTENLPSGDPYTGVTTNNIDGSILQSGVALAFDAYALLRTNLLARRYLQLVEVMSEIDNHDQQEIWIKKFVAGTDALKTFRCESGKVANQARGTLYIRHLSDDIDEAMALQADPLTNALSHATLNGNPTPNMRASQLSLLGDRMQNDVESGHLQNLICEKEVSPPMQGGQATKAETYAGKSVTFNIYDFNIWCTYLGGAPRRLYNYSATYGTSAMTFSYKVDTTFGSGSRSLALPLDVVTGFADELMVSEMSSERLVQFFNGIVNVYARASWRTVLCEKR